MRMLHANDLSRLLSAQPGPCVTVYLDARDGDSRARKAKWKGFLKEADGLIRRNCARHKARFLLEPLRRTPDVVYRPPPDAEAVALFRSFTTAGYYPVREKAPEGVTVADTFHLKPLLKVIQEQERYFTLALSQKRISLYRGSRDGLSLMATFDADYGEGRGGETVEVPRGKEARDALVHFRPLNRVSRFVELTEPHVWRKLRHESGPLVLVGTPFMHRLYRNHNCYPHVSESGVPASLPHDRRLLHSRTWPVAERIFLRREAALSERFFEERARSRASDDLEDIAKASIQGRIAALLVSKSSHLFGALDRDKGGVSLRDRGSGLMGDCVLDDIAQEVILRKGQAFVLPEGSMPTRSPTAAVFRW